MNPRVYIETTIPSYLTAWPSRDLVRAADQQVTREWWGRRGEYELFASPLVVRECQSGDAAAAAARLSALAGLPLLPQEPAVYALAGRLMAEVPLPEKAGADALHIATAALHGMEFLLTWNCTHIANAVFIPRIEEVCRCAGCKPPVICTPKQLLGGDGDD